MSGSFDERLSVLALVDRAGDVQALDVPPARHVAPRVSPDGSRVVVQTDADEGSVIWIYELTGETAIRRLTFEGNNTRPLWTPDGERITFASDRDGAVSIYWKPADGSGRAERLTTAEEQAGHNPWGWSPDGRTLAFAVQNAGGVIELWTLSLGDPESTLELFAGAPQRQEGAAFSPDGKWLAYSYTQSSPGESQIFVEPVPATGAKHRITREPAIYPVWSRDGRKLFYRPAGQTGTLKAVTIATDPSLRFSDERVLPITGFQGVLGYRSYDPMPDGERFIMAFPVGQTTSAQAPRPAIHVVLNWTDELKERVPIP